jgi:regulator of replication initiation timing
MSDELSKCREKIAELMEENTTLRAANEDFGSLAERLNEALREERRAGVERRTYLRPKADRRQGFRSGHGMSVSNP